MVPDAQDDARSSGRRDWLLDLIVGLLALALAARYCVADEKPFKKVATAIVYSQASCAPCQRMKQQFNGTKLPVRFEERDAELDRNRIKSTPTTIFCLNGWPVLRVVGTVSPQQMKEHLARIEGR